MNNVVSVASQLLARPVLSCARWPAPGHLLGLARQVSRSSVSTRRKQALSAVRLPKPPRIQQRSFCQCHRSQFQATSIAAAIRARNPQKEKTEEPEEKGLAFRSSDLTSRELSDVFGPQYPKVQVANRLLRVLQGRRNDGTLDLPLPPDLQAVTSAFPYVFDSGLQWLRINYPIDEDAAIVARLEREELGQDYSPSELTQRGQDIGLYGPQSGYYHAPLSESDREGDVWGKSELEQIRAENEAKAAREEEELQAEIDQKMAEEQLRLDEVKKEKLKFQEAQKQQADSKYVAALPESALSTDVKPLRPPNEYEKWIIRHKKEATSNMELESPEVAELSTARRLLPSAFFVALICIGCYLYAQYWTPPRRANRVWPDVPLTYATIGALFLMNLAVLAAWRFPPLWKTLNKYFIMTPGYPRVLSMIGCTFSHQSPLHFLNNMAGLAIIGTALHEEVGRGNFLAIYLAGGAIASLGSFAHYARCGIFITSSLGASGSVCAVVAALLWLNADKKFTIIFAPDAWKDWLSADGRTLTAAIVMWEIGSMVFKKASKFDHVGHLWGMLAGLVIAQAMRRTRMKDEQHSASKGYVGVGGLYHELRNRILVPESKRKGETGGGRDMGAD
ncbi:Presenilins-associated rhomboid-like protein, mitochondrial [Cyphellophora attinorum]|uniref:Presenilins-associated rhomboid-like protein, mitochondrial n=1 Tax=Cyphellophora attinorum TaxID=1664694 RepID=A0A0N1H2P0_9EURO|nr:Presenilins-associated rhomboid-like protein, mitochondrial [Phialophora attinorum]KPI38993.1 Presenilins-associated rhomboid-like protein, mitochondrial [Phialophora attinorum]